MSHNKDTTKYQLVINIIKNCSVTKSFFNVTVMTMDYIYPPLANPWWLCKLGCICITKLLDCLRNLYPAFASKYKKNAANQWNINEITAKPYDHDKWLKFGYINQSLRQHCPPNIDTARNNTVPEI